MTSYLYYITSHQLIDAWTVTQWSTRLVTLSLLVDNELPRYFQITSHWTTLWNIFYNESHSVSLIGPKFDINMPFYNCSIQISRYIVMKPIVSCDLLQFKCLWNKIVLYYSWFVLVGMLSLLTTKEHTQTMQE